MRTSGPTVPDEGGVRRHSSHNNSSILFTSILGRIYVAYVEVLTNKKQEGAKLMEWYHALNALMQTRGDWQTHQQGVWNLIDKALSQLPARDTVMILGCGTN